MHDYIACIQLCDHLEPGLWVSNQAVMSLYKHQWNGSTLTYLYKSHTVCVSVLLVCGLVFGTFWFIVNHPGKKIKSQKVDSVGEMCHPGNFFGLSRLVQTYKQYICKHLSTIHRELRNGCNHSIIRWSKMYSQELRKSISFTIQQCISRILISWVSFLINRNHKVKNKHFPELSKEI